MPNCEVHNVYGPTEASMTWCACNTPGWNNSVDGSLCPAHHRYKVPLNAAEILIGSAISNTVVLLLDENMEPTKGARPRLY